jgi:hypothetical protein
MGNDAWLAMQYWYLILRKAIADSIGSHDSVLKRVGLFVLIAVITAAVTFIFQGKQEAQKHVTKTVLKSALVAVIIWFLSFLFFFTVEPAKMEQQTLTLYDTWPNKYIPCIMQNITIPPVKKFLSSSETISFCNRKYSAPLTIAVQFDKNPDATSGLAFPAERTVSAETVLQDHTFFAKLDSPSILPYQIFIVTVHSNDKVPPIATSITINSINPDK